MILYLLALLIGAVAGLRTMMAPAAVSWAAYLGLLPLEGSPLAFLGHWISPWIMTVLAVGELIGDKLPSTPSRKVPYAFASRIVSGSVSGAAVGIAGGAPLGGLVAGAVGAVIGTLGGAAARARLAAAFGRDFPAALLEDAVAILAAVLVVAAVP